MNIPRVTGPIGYAVQMVFDRLISFLQRWLTLNVDAVANLAALAALDAAAVSNGASKRVLTLRADFVLDKTSVLAADGITVVTALGGGRWIRTAPDQPDAVWQRQATWFINATTGNDEAGGSTSPTAIKTWAEYIRRVGTTLTPSQDTVVTIQTDLPPADPIGFAVRGVGHSLQVQGVPTVTATSTVVSFTRNYAANESALLSIAGFDAAGNERAFIRFPDAISPGVDAWSIVLANLGNGVGGAFRCARPLVPDVRPNGFAKTYDPVPGVACELCSLSQVTVANVRLDAPQVPSSLAFATVGSLALQFMHLRIVPPTGVGSLWTNGDMRYSCNLGNCYVENLMTSGFVASNSYILYLEAFMAYGSVFGGAICGFLMARSQVSMFNEPVIQSDATSVLPASFTFDGCSFSTGGFGFYASTANLKFQNNSEVTVSGKVFGDGGGTRRIVLINAAKMDYASGALVLTNPAEVIIDGTTMAIANLPYVASSGSGAFPDLSMGNSYRRPLSAGVRGAVANGTTYAGTDLTGNVADTAFVIVTSTGFLKNLRGYAVTAAGGVTATVTVMINGVASTVTAATAAGGQTLSDTTHTVPVVAGDRVSFRVVTTNVGYADLSISAEIV